MVDGPGRVVAHCRHSRGGRSVTGGQLGRLVELQEDAFARALGGRCNDGRFCVERHQSELGRAARVVEDLAVDAEAFGAIGDAVFEDREDLRCVVSADAVAGAQILIDPHSQPVYVPVVHTSGEGSRGCGTERQSGDPRPTVTIAPVTSTFGERFRITTFGESHGPAVGVVLDGCPPGVPIDPAAIQSDLDRRRPGQSRLVTQRKEGDEVEFLSGVFDGVTTGTALAMMVRNADQNSGAYDHLKDVYRPSHADWTYEAKFGIRDHRGGGRSSARETIGRVAAAAVARQMLRDALGLEVLAWVSQVHHIDAVVDDNEVTLDQVEADPTRCPDPTAAAAMTEAIEQARRDGDSLGGVVTFTARNVPAGLGEPVFDKLDAELAKAMMSLPATKGFEIGSGFAGTRMTGLAHNDPFEPGPDGRPIQSSNRSGGIQGGISSGSDIVGRVAFKPTATIASEQKTTNTAGDAVTLAAKGRHDPCVLPRAVPMVEAMALLVLADHWLRQKSIS